MNRSKSKRGKITQLPLFINKLLEMVEVLFNLLRIKQYSLLLVGLLAETLSV